MLDSRYQGMGINGGGYAKEERWDSKIQWFELKPGTWNQIRLYGPVYIVAQNWYTTLKQKKFALFSLSWDPFERNYTKMDQDPIWQFFGNPFDHQDERIKAIAPRQQAFVQAFVRPTVGLPQGGDYRPLRLPISVINGIRKASQLCFKTDQYNQVILGPDNKPEIADPTDEVFGTDIMIYYDPSKNGSEKYSVQMGAKSPLTQNELAMSAHFIDWNTLIKMPTQNDVKEALSRNGYLALANSAGAGSFGTQAEIGAGHAAMPQMPQAPVAAPVMPAPAPGPMAPQMPQAPQAPMMPQAPAAPQAPAYPNQGIGMGIPAAPAPQVPQMPAAPTFPGKI